MSLKPKKGCIISDGERLTNCLEIRSVMRRNQIPIRLKSEAVGRGVECEIVTPDRISELCPLVRIDDLKGGLWIPGDCVANPFEICVALSVLAQVRYLMNLGNPRGAP